MNNLILSGQSRFADLELVPLEREIPQSTALEQLFAALYRQRYLLAACVGAVWVAGRIYRVGLLMYGKRPTFGEIMRWVRAA